MCFEASRWMSVVFSIAAAASMAAGQPAPAAGPTLSPASADGYFPLEQVHRGLHGVAYTVFEGTQPEAMQVEILGVLRNALGPHRDMILARLQGSKPEYTGVVAGMSGSPVYIDGKLLGALSYRIGQFSKEPIAGITPIAQMLDVRDIAGSPSRPMLETASLQRSASAGIDASADIHPIETPLSLSGFSPQALQPFRDRLAAVGLTAVDGVGGGSPDTKQPEPLVPGSAVSALMVTGDLEMAATCTVTYIDPKQLLACGHPISQSGGVSMPMTKAEVVATLASPLNAFKIINTTELAGAFNQDRASAIRGTLGEKAKLIPVTLSVDGPASAGKKTETLHFSVIDDPQMTPLLVLLSTYQALLENNQYSVEMSYRVRGTIRTSTGQEVTLDSLAAPSELMPSAIGAVISLGDRFSRVYANRARTLKIESVNLHIDSVAGNNSLEIESAVSMRPSAHAGDIVMIDTVLRPFQQPPRHVQVPVTLPTALPSGPVRVVLSGAAELDRMLQAPSLLLQTGLDENATIAQLNAAHTNDAVYATILTPGAQAILEGRTLSTLPISMVNAMEPMRNSRKMTLNGESAILASTVPLDGMVTGQQVVTIEVD